MLVFLYMQKPENVNLLRVCIQHGVSVSYDRVLQISQQLGEAVVNRVAVEGLVCPSVLQNGIFTTAAVDNIDHNPSSTT